MALLGSAAGSEGTFGPGTCVSAPVGGQTVDNKSLDGWAMVYSTHVPRTVQHGTVQCSTVEHGTARRSTVQYSTVRHSTVQYSTAQHGTVQYSTAPHGTVQ